MEGAAAEPPEIWAARQKARQEPKVGSESFTRRSGVKFDKARTGEPGSRYPAVDRANSIEGMVATRLLPVGVTLLMMGCSEPALAVNGKSYCERERGDPAK